MKIPEKFSMILSISTILITIFISIMIQYGGLFLHSESSNFILNYWDNSRSVATLIFDPLSNDWGLYQARELSYFFDYFDASFILFCIESGIPHYFSYITITFYSLAAISFIYLSSKEFKNISDSSALVISLMMLVMPGIFWGLCFFRSSKPACTFSLVVLSFGINWLFNNFQKTDNDNQKRKVLSGIFLLEIFMLMMDRQGFIFTAIISVGLCIALAILALRKRSNGSEWLIKLLIYTLIALAWGTFYNLYLGPKIIFAINNYYPSSSYQDMGIGSLFNFRAGLTFIMYNMGGILGGSGVWIGYLFTFFIGAGILLPIIRRKSDLVMAERSAYYFIAYIYVLFCFIVTANIMASRHPAILWADVIRGGYFNPFLVVILFFFALSINSFLVVWKFRNGKHIITAFLFVILLANVIYLPEARKIIINGQEKVECDQAQNLLQVLRDPSIDYHMVNLSIDNFNIVSFIRGKPQLKYIPMK